MKWIAYIRSFLSVLLYPLVTAVLSVLEISLNLIFNKRSIDDSVLQLWGRVSCWMFGVKVKVVGQENLPASGAILLFNHTSFFDIFVMAASLKGIRFGAKEELFRIPLFGAVMRRIGILEIARERREEVFKVYEAAQQRFSQGEKFALAPEGTRQLSEKLGPFKSGPFIFAINAQVPLVPIVIKGAAALMPKNAILPNRWSWQSEIELHVLPSVPTAGLSREQRFEVSEKVRERMGTVLQVESL